MADHQVKGQALGKDAEFLAVGRADQLVQLLPALQFVSLAHQGGLAFPLLLLVAVVDREPFTVGAEAL